MNEIWRAAAIVPGAPHLVQRAAAYPALSAAMEAVDRSFQAAGVERLVLLSSQWLSVLGQMVQGHAVLRGNHVDENWHRFGPLTFEMTTDTTAAARIVEELESSGTAAQLVDYEGFPVDTGTIVANTLLNPHGLPTVVVASHVYSDADGAFELGQRLHTALRQDDIPTAVVAVTGLSAGWYTHPMTEESGNVSHPDHDAANRRLLERLAGHGLTNLRSQIAACAAEGQFDLGGKILHTLAGCLDGTQLGQAPSACHAYGGIHGSGAAVVEIKGAG